MSSSMGSSCLHGPHHDAHTSSSSTCPRYDDTLTDLPDMRCTVISGAGWPTWRPSPDGPPPAVAQPTKAATATNATMPAKPPSTSLTARDQDGANTEVERPIPSI